MSLPEDKDETRRIIESERRRLAGDAVTLTRKQCPYCRGTYEVDLSLSVESEWTADPPQPAGYCVAQQGVVLHLCERGHDVTPSTNR